MVWMAVSYAATLKGTLDHTFGAIPIKHVRTDILLAET